MSGGISASSPPPSRILPTPNSQTPTRFSNPAWRSSSASAAGFPRASRDPHPLRSNSLLELRLGPTTSPSTSYGALKLTPRNSFSCNCSSTSGGPPPGGESDSKHVLDAFFLGKALAEALNERIESTVGEFLSTVGRLQAEQQKQIQDFQEEVLEKAKRAKEKAAREAMEAQGLISKSPTTNVTTFTNGVISKTAPLSTEVPSGPPSTSNSSALTTIKDVNSTDTDPLLGISIDD